MAEFIAQALKGIKQLPVLTVQPRFDSGQAVADLLHPDSFVADTDVTLRQVVTASDRGVHLLGKRLASMVTSKDVLPLGLKYFGETGMVRFINRRDESDAFDIDPNNKALTPCFSLSCDFATVEMAILPPVGSSYLVSTIIEDDAAILVALDGPLTAKVIVSLKPSVMVDSLTAAIVPPRTPLFMQGARSMLIRPTLV